MRELRDQTQLAEVDLALRLAHLAAVQLDDLDRRRLHRAGGGLEGPAVEQPDELEQCGCLRGHVLQRSRHRERRVVVPDGIDRSDPRTRSDRGEVGRTRQQRRRAARAATGRPDPHRDRHGRVGEVVEQRVHVDVDRRRGVDLEDDDRGMHALRVAQRRTNERGVGGIDEPVDLHDVDAAVAHVLRAGDRAERSREHRTSADSYE